MKYIPKMDTIYILKMIKFRFFYKQIFKMKEDTEITEVKKECK